MATEAAWLNGNKLTERRKSKCALTSTGLLMEGPSLERHRPSCFVDYSFSFSHHVRGLTKITTSPGFGEAVNLPQIFAVAMPC
jgi:hypothetical protein